MEELGMIRVLINTIKSNIIFIFKVMFFIGTILILCISVAWASLEAVYFSNPYMVFWDKIDYIITFATWIILGYNFLCFSLIFYVIRKNRFYSWKNFFSKRFKELYTPLSISVVLSLIAVFYTLLTPSIVSVDHEYEKHMINNLRAIDEDAFNLISEGNFLELSNKLVDNEYEKDEIRYRLLPNRELEKNLILAKEGEYKKYFTDYLGKTTEKGEVMGLTDNAHSVISEYDLSLEEGSQGSIHMRLSVYSDTPDCFTFSAQYMNGENYYPAHYAKPYWSSSKEIKNNEVICLHRNEKLDPKYHQDGYFYENYYSKNHPIGYFYDIYYTFRMESNPGGKIIFKVTPTNNEAGSHLFGQAVFRSELFGKSSEIEDLDFCLEANHISDPERKFSYEKGEIKKHGCT